MSNDYFDSGDYTAITAHTLGRAEAINNTSAAIVVGFDKLPTELRIKQSRITWGTFGGTANAHTVTLATPLTGGYLVGLSIGYLPTLANTTALTVNVDGAGVVAVKRSDGTALIADDVVANKPLRMTHNGTDFTLDTPPATVLYSSAASAAASAASAVASAASAAAASASASAASSSASAAAASAGSASAAIAAVNNISAAALYSYINFGGF